MNSGDYPEPSLESAPVAGIGLDDVLYTLFRHKWLILCSVAIGLIAAGLVRLLKPPLYKSEAKISVNFVLQSTGVTPANPETQMATPGFGGQAIMDAEVEILKSLDTAYIAATNIGPAKILAKKGGGDDPMAAAGLIASGLTVEPPRSATISITFKHPDPSMAQPVLEELIRAYKRRHDDMRTFSDMEEIFAQDKEAAIKKLAELDEKLRDLKRTAGVLNPEDAKKTFQDRIAKLQDELFEADSRLAQRQALYGEWLSKPGDSTETGLPLEVANDYREIATQLEEARKQLRKQLLELTPLHPDVIKAKARIQRLSQTKDELETRYPSLKELGAEAMPAQWASTNALATNAFMATAEIRALQRASESISNQLASVKADAFRLMDVAKEFSELENRRKIEQRNLDSIVARLENARMADSNNTSSAVTGIYLTQSPTPPGIDMKKQLKLVGGAFGGCIALGLGLAFLIDLVLDRTIKRSTEIRRRLQLPVMLTIPDKTWSGGWCPAWLARKRHVKIQHYDPEVTAGASGLAPWSPTHQLRQYTDGLRERLITYFEVHGINHQPKLVGVTSCGEGVGVTTLASGLAASLSMTGQGNALLVDMNVNGGITHSYHKGQPGCDLSGSLEVEQTSESANHYLATLAADPAANGLHRGLPEVITDMIPDLKVSGYDFIVFDLPPVSQTSTTPRLSGHLDMVFLVLESEETSQHLAMDASDLMRGAKANVAAILNKCRQHVPAAISTGF